MDAWFASIPAEFLEPLLQTGQGVAAAFGGIARACEGVARLIRVVNVRLQEEAEDEEARRLAATEPGPNEGRTLQEPTVVQGPYDCPEATHCVDCQSTATYLGRCSEHPPEYGQHYCRRCGKSSTKIQEEKKRQKHLRPYRQASLAGQLAGGN